MRVSVEVDGMAELQANLAKLRPATGKAALNRAGIKAMRPMADLAQSMAPKESGELAGSIVVSAKAKGSASDVAKTAGRQAYAAAMRSGAGVAGARSALRTAARGARAAAGADVPAIELFMGPTEARSKDAAIKRIVQEFGSSKMAPNSYMRPAFDQDKASLVDRLRPLLWAEINKAIARVAARAAKVAP